MSSTVRTKYSHLNLACQELYKEKLSKFTSLYRLINFEKKGPPAKKAETFEQEEFEESTTETRPPHIDSIAPLFLESCERPSKQDKEKSPPQNNSIAPLLNEATEECMKQDNTEAKNKSSKPDVKEMKGSCNQSGFTIGSNCTINFNYQK